MYPLLVVIFVLSDLYYVKSHESVQYLQNAMWELKNRLNPVNAKRRMDTLQVKSADVAKEDHDVPPIALTKAELAALYEAALHKEQALGHDGHGNNYVQTVVQEMDGDASNLHQNKANYDGESETSGYYYYYYPISSFIDGPSPHSQGHSDLHVAEDEVLHPTYHAHTHQHNVHITAHKAHLEDNKKKMMEPLFVAVSSFIGMAVMFVLSVIFLPKFGVLKSRGVKQNGEMTNLLHVVLRAIEGDDCSERIACELGKAAKALKAHDNRFVKFFKRLSPSAVRWYMDGITKYAQTDVTCSKIQCRPKSAMKPKNVHRKH